MGRLNKYLNNKIISTSAIFVITFKGLLKDDDYLLFDILIRTRKHEYD